MSKEPKKEKEIMRLVSARILWAFAASLVVRNQRKKWREAGFMIFPCCAVPLRQKESAADTSQRIQNKYYVFYANVLKPFNLAGECWSVISVYLTFKSNI